MLGQRDDIASSFVSQAICEIARHHSSVVSGVARNSLESLESVDGDISYSVCSVWGLVLGQVYCHYDYYNFSRERQGWPQNNCILSDLSIVISLSAVIQLLRLKMFFQVGTIFADTLRSEGR